MSYAAMYFVGAVPIGWATMSCVGRWIDGRLERERVDGEVVRLLP